MITTTDTTLYLLLSNFRDKVHIEYVKPEWDYISTLIQENNNPHVTVDYNHRNLKLNIVIEV